MTRKPNRQPTRKQMAQQWEDMTSAERRVALAEDVLASLEANEIALAAATGYITAKNQDWEEKQYLKDYDPDKCISKQKCNSIKKNCTMCARGALMMARIDKYNSITWERTGRLINVRGFVTSNVLSDAFSAYQLKQIECAFERSPAHLKHSTGGMDAARFGSHITNANLRMMAICQNIIDHDGEFCPSVQYEIV